MRIVISVIQSYWAIVDSAEDRTTKGIDWNDMDCSCVSPLFGFSESNGTTTTRAQKRDDGNGDPTKPNTKHNTLVYETNGIAQYKCPIRIPSSQSNHMCVTVE